MMRHALAAAFVLTGMLASCHSGGRSRAAAEPATLEGTWRVVSMDPPTWPGTEPWEATIAPLTFGNARFVISEERGVLAVGDGPVDVSDDGLIQSQLYGPGHFVCFRSSIATAAQIDWQWRSPTRDEEESSRSRSTPTVPTAPRCTPSWTASTFGTSTPH
jgi:hypothetical protein